MRVWIGTTKIHITVYICNCMCTCVKINEIMLFTAQFKLLAAHFFTYRGMHVYIKCVLYIFALIAKSVNIFFSQNGVVPIMEIAHKLLCEYKNWQPRKTGNQFWFSYFAQKFVWIKIILISSLHIYWNSYLKKFAKNHLNKYTIYF